MSQPEPGSPLPHIRRHTPPNNFHLFEGRGKPGKSAETKTAKLLCKNGNDLWNDSSYTNEKIEILLAIISERIGSRKMWMPRIAGA